MSSEPKRCPVCYGAGKIHIGHTGPIQIQPCADCNGKGWVVVG